jgi:hypothetical protein
MGWLRGVRKKALLVCGMAFVAWTSPPQVYDMSGLNCGEEYCVGMKDECDAESMEIFCNLACPNWVVATCGESKDCSSNEWAVACHEPS